MSVLFPLYWQGGKTCWLNINCVLLKHLKLDNYTFYFRTWLRKSLLGWLKHGMPKQQLTKFIVAIVRSCWVTVKGFVNFAIDSIAPGAVHGGYIICDSVFNYIFHTQIVSSYLYSYLNAATLTYLVQDHLLITMLHKLLSTLESHAL